MRLIVLTATTRAAISVSQLLPCCSFKGVNMSSNLAFWSSVGFWMLMVGLVGDIILIFVPSGRTEKILATIFTLLIAAGVAVEHVADAKRFAPRDLSEQQQDFLVSRLKLFAGQKVDFVIKYSTEEEPAHIARQLREVLVRGEWPSSTVTGMIDTGPVLHGIAIGTNSSADSSAQQATAALISALGEVGLEVTEPVPSDIKVFNLTAPVRIIIGRK